MHSSLHSDKRRGADCVQKGPPTRLIKPLRHHRPVSFAALTVRLFNILYMGTPDILPTADPLRPMPPWNNLKLL